MRWTAIAVIALVWAGSAAAHGTGAHRGLVSTVAGTDPVVAGLVPQIIGVHKQITLRNLTPREVVMFDGAGRPVVHIAPGEVRVWADPRITWTGPLPKEQKLLRNWRIEGRVGRQPFAIVGFLGYVPPPADPASGGGTSPWLIVGAVAVGLVALAGLGVGARLAGRAPTS